MLPLTLHPPDRYGLRFPLPAGGARAGRASHTSAHTYSSPRPASPPSGHCRRTRACREDRCAIPLGACRRGSPLASPTGEDGRPFGRSSILIRATSRPPVRHPAPRPGAEGSAPASRRQGPDLTLCVAAPPRAADPVPSRRPDVRCAHPFPARRYGQRISDGLEARGQIPAPPALSAAPGPCAARSDAPSDRRRYPRYRAGRRSRRSPSRRHRRSSNRYA